MLEAAQQIQETRFFSGMVQTGLLPALPSLEEDVARRLAHVAWKAGHPEATALFLDFLSLNSQVELDATDRQIQAEILEKGLASSERLDLYRARRLLNLVKTTKEKDQAADILKRLWEDTEVDRDVRLEAGYEWAYYKRRQRDRAEVLTVLTEILNLAGGDPVAEKALYLRGTVHNRGRDADVEAFQADMLELLRRFSTGRLADNALFQLASQHFFENELEKSLAYFRKLRQLEGPHDYQDSAYYIPALGLLGRNANGHTDRANQLLAEYEKRYPNGVFRLRSLFWRGRIAEGRDSKEAGASFGKWWTRLPMTISVCGPASIWKRARRRLAKTFLLWIPRLDESFPRGIRKVVSTPDYGATRPTIIVSEPPSTADSIASSCAWTSDSGSGSTTYQSRIWRKEGSFRRPFCCWLCARTLWRPRIPGWRPTIGSDCPVFWDMKFRTGPSPAR